MSARRYFKVMVSIDGYTNPSSYHAFMVVTDNAIEAVLRVMEDSRCATEPLSTIVITIAEWEATHAPVRLREETAGVVIEWGVVEEEVVKMSCGCPAGTKHPVLCPICGLIDHGGPDNRDGTNLCWGHHEEEEAQV